MKLLDKPNSVHNMPKLWISYENFCKEHSKVEKVEYFWRYPDGNVSKSRVLAMRIVSHIPDQPAGLCTTIFELNLRKWVHFQFSNNHEARPKESVRNRLRRKLGWYNDVFCEKCQVDAM